MRWSLFLLLCLALIGGCREEELETLAFFEVSIDQPVAGSALGTLELSGLISRDGGLFFEDHGFIWSDNLADLEGEAAGAQKLPRGQKTGGGRFTGSLSGLALNKAYFFRAYARAGPRRALSDTIASFSFEFRLEAGSVNYIYNDQAQLTGFVFGLQNLRAAVQQHGHIISLTSDRPTALDSTNAYLGGPMAIDEPFASHFGGLEFNTTYYAWAYATTESGFYSSDEPVVFRIRDGWRPNLGFPEDITYALAQSIGNKGYLVFGCEEFGICGEQGFINSGLWEFAPVGNAGWRLKEMLPPYIALTSGGISFVIGDELFFGLGQDASGSLNRDLWKGKPQLAPVEWIWAGRHEQESFERRDAVAFVIGGKAYIGAGVDASGRLLSDFWEFSPAEQGPGTWRQVASLKYLMEGASDTTFEGRINPAAFSFANGAYGFVGGGDRTTQYLKDFWKFYPPSPGQDSGKWEFHSFFPGEARSFAVAFTIGEKAYYGLGLNDREGFHRDFWEFDPTLSGQQAWREVAEFQGAPRELAIGFSIDSIGYVGTGDSLQITGRSTVPKSTRDIWAYYPEN